MVEYSAFERECAVKVVQQSVECGRILGVRGIERETLHTCPVSRLAELGVPNLIEVPYGSERVRALVQELAQLYVDCGPEAAGLSTEPHRQALAVEVQP